MKNKKIISALLIIAMLSAVSCDSKTSDPTSQDTTASETTVTETEVTSSASETSEGSTEETSEETTKPTRYVHGEDGYYNLLEDNVEADMSVQVGGTCWAYAANFALQGSYSLKYGKKLEYDPLHIVDLVYGDKEEGYILNGGNKFEIGAWTWMVAETLSNGFDGYVIDRAMIIDPDDKEYIKDCIRKYGPIIIDVDDTQSTSYGVYLDGTTVNQTSNTKTTNFDHVVTIVGWDDNFPKENFPVEAAHNGAWIAYNSQMNAGYQYMSYEQIYDEFVLLGVSEDYSDILSYDCGNERDAVIKTEVSTKAANVFHKKGTLAAVGTYSNVKDQKIIIDIMDAGLNEIIYSQEAELDYHGYHVITLDEPLEVDDYAIAITYENGAPVEGVTVEVPNEATYLTTSKKGQSFVFKDDKWVDMTELDEKCSVRSVSGTLDMLAPDSINNSDTVKNNVCIKALYK